MEPELRQVLQRLYELNVLWERTHDLEAAPTLLNLFLRLSDRTSAITQILYDKGYINFHSYFQLGAIYFLTELGLEVICDKQLEIKYED